MPLKFKYESDMLFSYIVLELASGSSVLNHQAEMIIQNPSTGFVPFHVRREDEKVRVFYNITSKLPLSQYLSRKTLSKIEFLDLLRSINKNLMGYVSYYLDISGFILDEDLIFINPSTGDTSLIYVPHKFNRDFNKDYKSFITDLIVNTANLDDNINDNFLQKLLGYLKSEEFNLNDFNRLVIDLKISGSETVCGVSTAYIDSEERTKGKVHPELAYSEDTCSGTGQTPKNNKSLLITILVQVFLVLVAAITCLMLVSKKNADITTISGVVIIAAALDALYLYRTSANCRTGILKDDRQAERENEHHRKQEKGNSPFKGKAAPKPIAALNRRDNKQTSTDCSRVYDTVVIGPHTKLPPYLDGIGTRGAEKIVISKDKFVLGRLKNYVDYTIESNLVGKVHAEIIRNGDSYYIKDLNSKNGTYVNNEKIPSNEEHAIKENDRIRFANMEYIFKV